MADSLSNLRRGIVSVSAPVLRRARDRFAELLSRRTTEPEWQRFFTECPFVFSEALPVSIAPHDIVPRGRPGRSEADFIFCATNHAIPVYGVIELKRPDTKILNLPRRNVLRLSGDAQTALAQAQLYAVQLERELFIHPSRALVLGSRAYAFIILGLSQEFAEVVGEEILKAQYDRLLPPGFELIPYDTLFGAFSSAVPPSIYMLVPEGGNPPASVAVKAGIVVVDYAGSGAPATPDATEISSLHGVIVESWPGGHLRLTRNGCCPFCGELDGSRSLAARRPTGVGTIEKFFTGGSSKTFYRDLECTRRDSAVPLRYREEYDAAQVMRWFSDLKKGICRRCGFEDVESDEFSPMDHDLIEKWKCRRCGLWLERHSWGIESDGA